LGQATKFVSGMFGVGNASGKKDKGQLKSLQAAAALAKKVRDTRLNNPIASTT